MASRTIRSLEVIAEIAQGFEGNPAQALLLLRAAARSGADAAKLQMVFADELAIPSYKHYELFHSLEMSNNSWQSLFDEACAQNIDFQVDVFGHRSLALAENIGIRTIKLHGTDLGNPSFLHAVAKSNIKRVLLGAGGAHRKEIFNAIDILSQKDVVVIFGFQAYPTPIETNQIDRVRHMIEIIADNSRVCIGFADHADPESPLSIALASAAIGAGATIIEKHLTLGRCMELEDYESALNPDQFKEFTYCLRSVEAAIGDTLSDEDFGMTSPEKDYRRMIRRNVVASHDLAAGQIITFKDISLKRSNIANPINEPINVIGRRLRKSVTSNTAITLSDLE